jgi:hypothetical protein
MRRSRGGAHSPPPLPVAARSSPISWIRTRGNGADGWRDRRRRRRRGRGPPRTAWARASAASALNGPRECAAFGEYDDWHDERLCLISSDVQLPIWSHTFFSPKSLFSVLFLEFIRKFNTKTSFRSDPISSARPPGSRRYRALAPLATSAGKINATLYRNPSLATAADVVSAVVVVSILLFLYSSRGSGDDADSPPSGRRRRRRRPRSHDLSGAGPSAACASRREERVRRGREEGKFGPIRGNPPKKAL